jgi:hypothetical protein
VISKKKTFPASTAAKIDRITSGMLQQLDIQTRAALTLLEYAPEQARGALLARIADVRGRLVKLRASILGPSAPKLAEKARRDSHGSH